MDNYSSLSFPLGFPVYQNFHTNAHLRHNALNFSDGLKLMTFGGAAVKVEPFHGKLPKGNKPEHRNSRAARRGPMDEMRQLIRILAKLMPHSEPLLKGNGGEDTSGGNRVSEEQIRTYLATSLGEAPLPEWGLPQGWGQYLADLFNWAKGSSDITADEGRRCAKRGTGRPWEAVWSEVHRLGVFPEQWPLPLNLAAVQQAQAGSYVQIETAAASGPLSAEAPQPQTLTRKCSSASTSIGDVANGATKRARNPSTTSEVARAWGDWAGSVPPMSALQGMCTAMHGLPSATLLKVITCAAELIGQQGIGQLDDVGSQVEALSKLMAVLPTNVTTAVVSQHHGGSQRQEDILSRMEQVLAVYESKVVATHGSNKFGTSNVPNLFVSGNAVIGCPASEAVPLSAVDAPSERRSCHTMKVGKDKVTPVEHAASAPGKDGSVPKVFLPSQDTSLPPEISNSQLQFLQCLQNSQDVLPECPVGPSQENLFSLSQPTIGASDPLMGASLSQGPWTAHGSDPLAGPTTSQLLASQPTSSVPAVGENDGAQ